jgi:cbb3-type cytochrome oxidase maturation protein
VLIIILTISISLILATVFVIAFIWSARSGQYSDLVTPAHRMLIDDKQKKTTEIKSEGDKYVDGE